MTEQRHSIIDLLTVAGRTFAEGRTSDAEALYRQALDRSPGHPAAHAQLAAIAFQRGDIAEAEQHCAIACRSRPDHAGLRFNHAVALTRAGRNVEAVVALRRALLLVPEAPDPARALVRSLMALDRPLEQALQRALVVDPTDPEGWYNLGVIRIADGRLAAAVRASRRNGRLLRGHPLNPPGRAPYPELPASPVRPASRQTCLHRLRHDRDQLAWLADRGQLPAELQGQVERYSTLIDSLSPEERAAISFDLSADQYALIADSYNRLSRLADTGWQPNRPALNPALDWPALERGFLAGQPRCLTIDSLLTAEALDALRSYCRGSTIWHQIKGAGYLGTYFRECFNDPLVVTIAGELQARLPSVLGRHPVRVIWAYSYDQDLVGINPHADFAGINLNFWIAPDDANLDPETGGLKIYRKAAAADWGFRTYNTASAEFIYDFLGDDRDDFIRVPHRANRAVMFDSRLIHETDSFRFKPGFENRRINITMLFGDGG